MIRALAKAKVDFNQKNNDGFTALDVAEGKQPPRAAGRAAGGGPAAVGAARTRREPAGRREAAARVDGPAAGASIHDRGAVPSSEQGDLRGPRCSSLRRRRAPRFDRSKITRRAAPTPKAGRASAARRKSRSPTRVAQPDVETPATFSRWSTRYCVGCHNTRNPLPAGAPLALDKANFADPGADAATWERVVKKLGVGAMPPQGSPTPGAAELARFRSALIASLDAAAAKKNNPASTSCIA